MRSKGNLRKAELRKILENKDWETFIEWSNSQRNAQSSLIGLLFDEDELLRWRSIEALGYYADHFQETGGKKITKIMFRLFWLMSDEAGAIGWKSPEAIGEMVAKAPSLIPEYGNVIASHMEVPVFTNGVLWAMHRISDVEPKFYLPFSEYLFVSTKKPEQYVQAFAGRIANKLKMLDGETKLSHLRDNSTKIKCYSFDKGDFEEYSVSEIVFNENLNI